MSNQNESGSEGLPRRRPPARTSRRRVQQLVAIAQDLVEERMLDKKASPTEVVAILRLGTETELANIERIKAQTLYLEAQRAKAEAETLNESLMSDAMKALGRYRGEDG
jgi:hypothetical protein